MPRAGRVSGDVRSQATWLYRSLFAPAPSAPAACAPSHLRSERPCHRSQDRLRVQVYRSHRSQRHNVGRVIQASRTDTGPDGLRAGLAQQNNRASLRLGGVGLGAARWEPPPRVREGVRISRLSSVAGADLTRRQRQTRSFADTPPECP